MRLLLAVFGFLAVLILIIVAVNVWYYRLTKDGSWHPHDDKMRRYVGGKWEYREMTDSEMKENANCTLWS